MSQVEQDARRLGPTGEEMGAPTEVATYLKVPVPTLYSWRHHGTGPRASRVGKHLRYRWVDVYRWLDEQAARNAA